ncbi:hypothetical protein OXPF_29810 [Oxobacter pfennigii]|uniref:Uncharacterized protein n=1 Tax=Oxobacter pfennigii TaxID=36849 RepID=A0A0P8W4N7_9CLOT|nr:hypothetical protein [Oxobacter pfennigii]KPU43540.1 hypothetical protein OXPF_29810 [Oxobacter pfennigii]
MNQGQELFYNFFIERVKDGKKEEAKLLLENSFAKQAAGTFDKAYLQEIMPKFFEIVKPEAVEEVKQAMDHFASRL